jgi:hypothetical protein
MAFIIALISVPMGFMFGAAVPAVGPNSEALGTIAVCLGIGVTHLLPLYLVWQSARRQRTTRSLAWATIALGVMGYAAAWAMVLPSPLR